MELFKDTNIDFLKYKGITGLISLIVIIAGIGLIFQRGLRYGVDFSGGTAIHLKFRQAVPLDEVRSTLAKGGFPDSGVQGFSDATQMLIRLPEESTSQSDEEAKHDTEGIARRVSELLSTDLLHSSLPEGKKDLNAATVSEISAHIHIMNPWNTENSDAYDAEIQKLMTLRAANTGLFPPYDQMTGIDPKVVDSLKGSFYIGDVTVLSSEYVGPQVGSELREQARLAIAWSLAGLLVYVWFRFEFLWGLSAIACLAHDVLITLAFFVFSGREISLTVVAAFLTIVGFSLNDTIVIYDRVRDNLKTMRTQPMENIINLSLNQMLSRTILTNGTVIVVTIVLFVFGGEVINDFAFGMLVGSISGTYSTIYIASALIILYEKYFGKKKLAPAKAKAKAKANSKPRKVS